MHRENEKYLHSLGNTILKLTKLVPDGLLVFFPSYPRMNDCVAFWKQTGIWESIEQQKQIFIESKVKAEFSIAIKGYRAAINNSNTNGAIFMAVMRGKISEGLDFVDMYGRGVIVTGIPLAPCKDPKIELKKKYLNEKNTGNYTFSGDEWYYLDACRAINQAIGRIIRHRNDYGAILLCEHRFNQSKYQNNISDWIRHRLRNQNSNGNFDSMLADLNHFFANAKNSVSHTVIE